MEFNRAAFGALAVFGIVAAGGGAYLANRHNDAAMQPVALYPAPAMSAVTETENTIMTPPAATVEAEPLVAAEPAPAPSRRANAVRREPAPVRTTPPASQRARTSSTTAAGNTSAPSPTYTPSTSSVDSPVSAAVEPLENTAVERTAVAPEPPRKLYDELVIPAE
jgi:hypothetical protein